MKYKTKPVEIEAMQCKEPNTPQDIIKWCGSGTRVCGLGDLSQKVWLEIETLEGTMKANYGDYIIKGLKGEFYPCKPDIFEMKYELLSNK